MEVDVPVKQTSNVVVFDKCPICRKRMSLLKFQCKFCDNFYCANHQLPEVHQCNIRDSTYFDVYKNKNRYKFDPVTKMDKLQTQGDANFRRME